jgi:large subunit ribosomal protein L23
MTIYDVLRRPVITEKSNYQNGQLNQVVFEVQLDATKAMVKEAIETLFEVKVDRVNTLVVPAKRSRRAPSRRLKVRRSGYKKAVITLAEGSKIDIFEGVK